MEQFPYRADDVRPDASRSRYPDSTSGRPGGLWLALPVLLAGTVPALSNLANFVVDRPTYLTIYFVVHLLPFVLGAGLAQLWPGRPLVAYALLGLTAGVVEAVVDLILVTKVEIGGYILQLEALDFVAMLATVLLFISGALVPERRRRGADRPTSTDQRPTTANFLASAPAILAVVGSMLDLIATMS